MNDSNVWYIEYLYSAEILGKTQILSKEVVNQFIKQLNQFIFS